MVLFYLGSVSFWSYFKCISFHCLNCQKWAEKFVFFSHRNVTKHETTHHGSISEQILWRTDVA